MSKLKTLIIGAKGYLGSHILEHFSHHQIPVLGTHYRQDKHLLPFDLYSFSDLSFAQGCAYALLLGGIVNPARCEKEPEKTHFINVQQTLKLAKELLKREVIPVFFSSDYVFDGREKKYHPLNQYGREKRELEEKALMECEGNCLILRCSRIFGTKKGDGTLFDKMADDLAHDRPIRAAVDQLLTPIHVEDVISGLLQLQLSNKRGIFDFAGSEQISRYEAAATLCRLLKKDTELVTPISLEEIEDGVKRPKRPLTEAPFSTRSLMKSLKMIASHYCPLEETETLWCLSHAK